MSKAHRDFEPFEMGENMEEDLGMFEAATHATRVELSTISFQKILVVLDNSNQTETCRSLAQIFSDRFSAQLHELIAPQLASEISLAAQACAADLIILPAPCGEDITELATESLGSIVDSLLHSATCPLLCVREPWSEEQIKQMLKQILLPLTTHNLAAERSLNWAATLIAPNGTLTLVEIADRMAIQQANELTHGAEESASIQLAAVERAMTSRLGGLIAAAQKQGQQSGHAVHVEFRLARPTPEIVAMAAELNPAFVVMGRHPDRHSAAFHQAADVLLGLKGPLLLV